MKQIQKNLIFIISIYLSFFIASCNKQNSYQTNLLKAVDEKNKQNTEKALNYINKAIKADSTKPFSYLIRGQIKALLKLDNSAIIDFNKTISLDTFLVAGYFYKAVSYSNLNHFDSAIASFDKAIELKLKDGIIVDYSQNENLTVENQSDISYVQIKFYKGIALLFSDRFEEAKDSFLYSLAKEFEISWSQYYLGITYIQLGKIDIGCTFLQKARSSGLENVDDLFSEYCSK